MNDFDKSTRTLDMILKLITKYNRLVHSNRDELILTHFLCVIDELTNDYNKIDKCPEIVAIKLSKNKKAEVRTYPKPLLTEG